MFIQKNFHPDSVGQFEGLSAKGHEVLALMQYTDGEKSGASSSVLRPERLDYGPLSRWLWRGNKKRLDRRGFPKARQILRALRRERPDVVVLREIRAVSVTAAVIAPFVGARVVLSWDKPKRARKSWFLAAGGGLLLPRLKIHRGHFGEIGKDFELGGFIGRSRLLPYPVRPHPRVAFVAKDSARVKLVTIGALSNRRKRLSWLTEAIVASGLSEDVEITYIGLGTEDSFFFREIRELERHHSIAPATILLNLSHSDVIELLPSFDLFVFPARNEPFGAVVPEAMAAGLPVISSSTCGSRVCFEDGVSGLIFASDSFEEFTQAVERMVRDSDLRRSMTVEAFRRVENYLNPSRWVEMFEELIQSSRPQRVMSSGEPPG